MKKLLLVAATAAGLVSVAPAFAADGTITVTGTVAANTCRIAGTSGTNVNVALPSVPTTALAAAGETAATTPFAINVSGCTGGTSAQAFFEPSASIDPTTHGLRNSTAAGSASNVQVKLLNSDLTQIQLAGVRGAQASQSVVTDTNGAGTLNYYAQYYATGAATPGSVNTSVQFTMVYN